MRKKEKRVDLEDVLNWKLGFAISDECKAAFGELKFLEKI